MLDGITVCAPRPRGGGGSFLLEEKFCKESNVSNSVRSAKAYTTAGGSDAVRPWRLVTSAMRRSF